jgi:CRP-like cAMP-binding protein
LVALRKDEKVGNRILAALPPAVREQVLHHCHYVELPAGHLISLEGSPLEHAYFINSGMISLMKTMRNGRRVEIGEIGIEGFAGLFAAQGFESALSTGEHYVMRWPTMRLCGTSSSGT